MDKFNLFRWKDFFIFGGIALAVSALTIYALIYGIALDESLMLIATSIVFWGMYGAVLLLRNNYLNKITFFTTQNIAVIANDFNVEFLDVQIVVNDTLNAWSKAIPGFNCEDAVNGMIIIFKKYPVKMHARAGNLAGYLIGDTAVVGYKENIDATALAHEIGHRIFNEWVGYAAPESCHDFMKKHDLR